MTIRQLEVFLAIAHAQSLSRAAERIHLSQPTLSEHMKELEDELGVPLFIRHSRSVSLTEEGRVFEDFATRVVATLAAGRHAIAELDGLKRRSIVVGASTTPGTYVLPARIAKFREQYPGSRSRYGSRTLAPSKSAFETGRWTSPWTTCLARQND